MNFIDFFAGIGGFRSGLEKAGHKCVGFVEFDKFARKSYQAMYDTKGEFTGYDIRQVRGKDLPTADIRTYGSPCQDVSIAGQQDGLISGKRSSLFFEIIRLLKERTKNQQEIPTYLFMENVKGLLSSRNGRDFARVLIEMDSVGYDVEWSLINSKEVVPQNRERVYLIGHLRGKCSNKVFPIQRQSQNSIKQSKIKQVGNYRSNKSFGNNPQTGRVYSVHGLSPTLNTMQGGDRQPKILVEAVLTPDRLAKRQNGRRFKNAGEPAFTVTATDKHGVLIKKDKELSIRKLTPLECWRLQGFTDEQFFKAKNAGLSDNQLYKQAGNSVTVPVIETIGYKLKGNINE